MFFVIDRPSLQRILSIVERNQRHRRNKTPFLRLSAAENELTVTGSDISATIPATVWEPGVLFLRPSVFHRLLATFSSETQFAIQVTETELLMGNVTIAFNPEQMRLFADPDTAPLDWPLGNADRGATETQNLLFPFEPNDK